MTKSTAPRVVWGDPPALRRSNAIYEVAAIVLQLKERPGQWAEVWRGVGGYSANRRRVLLREAGCEVAGTRGDRDAERIIFARYPHAPSGPAVRPPGNPE